MSSKADHQTGDGFYRGLVEDTTIGVWTIDADAATTWVNPVMCEMLGYTAEQMIGRRLHEFAEGEARAQVDQNLERRRRGVRDDFHFRFVRADGSTLWARVWAHPLLDRGGAYRGSVAYVADVGEAQAHARALEEDRALLAAAVEQTPAGVIVADPTMRVRLANREAVSMGVPEAGSRAGWPLGDRRIRWTVLDADGGALPPGGLPLTRAVREGATTVGRELLIVNGDGRRRPVLVNAAPVMDGDSLAGGVVVFTDITDLKRAERERDQLREGLQQAQRLESLGLLAGGIAHDFNNLLAVVIGELELALGDLEDHPAREGIARALDSARVGAGLTRQILSYAGQAPLDVQPLDLTALTRGMAPLIQAAVARRVRVELAVDGALPPVLADEGQIQQLLLNLVVNAAEAIGARRGRLRVQAYEVELDESDARALHPSTPVEPGGYVCLEVSDDGEGMSEQTLARLFDPFFSTKAPGRGLGLSTTLGIVRGHGAGLQVQSSPGEGSVFRVFLPPDTGRAAAPAPAEAPAEAPGTGALVLVVDDEGPVRAVFGAILERFGYRAILADSGEAALAIYQQRRGEIDLVLLDMTMPDMGGEEVCAELLAIEPEARIILCSGYTEVQIRQHFGSQGVAGFIQKPVRPRVLIQAVHRALSQG